MIASNCEQLEIFIDSVHLTTAEPAFGSPLYGGLSHPPFFVSFPERPALSVPELLIVGYAGRRRVAELRMSSDPAGDALAMAADDATISADGSDATRVVFRAVDSHGNQRRYPVGEVTLTLSGPATLIGDNPFAFGAYGGLGAVWIRSLADQPGIITLGASEPELGPAEVRVRSLPVKPGGQLA
jgi:beta-galactosidase